MLKFNDPQFQKNMSGIAAAFQASSSRTVKAMGLNAKDRTLDALAKYVDKPTPFTLRKGAYQASSPKVSGDDVVVRYSIGPIQSGYLNYLFSGGIRVPGDPGTARRRIWLPTFGKGSKNKYGNLPDGFVRKLARLISKNKKGKGAGSVAHYGFAKLNVRGSKAVGIWKFPGRKSYTTSKPLMRGGQAVMRRGKAMMTKVTHWFDLGEPILMAESRKQAHHRKRINFDALMEQACDYGIQQQPRYLDEELRKRGL